MLKNSLTTMMMTLDSERFSAILCGVISFKQKEKESCNQVGSGHHLTLQVTFASICRAAESDVEIEQLKFSHQAHCI